MVPSEWFDYKISSSYSNWLSKDYNQIVQSKTNIWYHLAKLGHNFIFSDPDVVWLNKNILQHLVFLFEHSYAHALFSQDQEKRNLYFNTGFFSLRSTDFTIDLLLQVIQIQRKKPKNAIEQVVFNDILKLNKFSDSRLMGLDPILFASGRVYFQYKINKNWNLLPYTVHANYMVGEKEKVKSLNSSGFWLVK